VGLSIIVIEPPNGDPVHRGPSFRFPVALCVSAPLREILTAWIRPRGVFPGVPVSGRTPSGDVEEFCRGRRCPPGCEFVEERFGLRLRKAVPQEEPFPVGSVEGTAGFVLLVCQAGGFRGETSGVRCFSQGPLDVTEEVQQFARTGDKPEAVEQTIAGRIRGEAATLGSLLDQTQFWNLPGAFVEVRERHVSLGIIREQFESLRFGNALIQQDPEQVCVR